MQHLITKIWKQPKYPRIYDWMKNLLIHNRKLCTVRKDRVEARMVAQPLEKERKKRKDMVIQFSVTWIDLESMLREYNFRPQCQEGEKNENEKKCLP